MIDPEQRSEIEKKAELFDSEEKRLASLINDGFRATMEKLEAARKELHEKVQAGFSENPYSKLLASLESGASPTKEEIDTLLAQDLPRPLGQNEDLFSRLWKEIESLNNWEGKSEEEKAAELIPKNVRCIKAYQNALFLSWDPVMCNCRYEVELKSLSQVSDLYQSFEPKTVLCGLKPGTSYKIRVRTVVPNGDESLCIWSNPITVKTESKFECAWKQCPGYVDEGLRYYVDAKNPRIATRTGSDGRNCFSAILGDTYLPLDKVSSWNINILKLDISGEGVLTGVVPPDRDISSGLCGWFFNPCNLKLYSGTPHKYDGKTYGPGDKWIKTVHSLYSVGAVMDTTKGVLSFTLNGINLGVAYEGIPLDEPLVPCVLLKHKGDSVELDFSEKKENVFAPIPVPHNITAKSKTWDSITLTWDADEGASFYQVEVDGSKILSISTSSSFTKKKLLPGCGYSFRVRAVRGNSVGKWSDEVKENTQNISFKASGWKECPDNVDENRKYFVDEKNPRIATKNKDRWSTIIGSTPLLLKKEVSWSINVLKSWNNGGNIFIGVAPSDINQNVDHNYEKCGWYFYCRDSALCSGPPHNCIWPGKEYGPRIGKGKYVHTGDSVGVVMDTTKGDLSFTLNGVNLGVAYEGIPLDKPLVPCVLFYYEGDSVELDTSEVKENVDSSIPVLSNITAKSTTWDSITLTWDAVEGASFYQIEVDGCKSWLILTTNTFTKRRLLAETEHTFRVRAVRGNSVSEWSDVVRGRTQKESFEGSWWKECPDNVDKDMKYTVDEENPRIARMTGDGCIITGNTPIPLNKVTSWSVKILGSEDNHGKGIVIGVAPSDLNQHIANNDISFSMWVLALEKMESIQVLPNDKKPKNMAQGKEMENTSTQETMLVLLWTQQRVISHLFLMG